MNNYCVYKHTGPTGKCYIGITSYGDDVNVRWKNGLGYSKQSLFFNAIQKYGWENFSHEILEDGLSFESACEKEREYIAMYRSNDRRYGYNRTTGGDLGFRHSEETKRYLSELRFGSSLSDEVKKKISEKAKKRPIDYQRLEKMHNAVRGKAQSIEQYERARLAHVSPVLSAESRKRLSDAAKLNKNRRKRVVCIGTGDVFESAREASIFLGKSKNAVVRAIHSGTRCGGYYWKYLDDGGELSVSISENNVHANIVMPKDLKERLMQLARSENRSFANYVVTVLQNHLKSIEK